MNEASKILNKTNYGLDVFKHYLGDGCTAKTFKNPLREDNVASCHLYLNTSRTDGSKYYFMQDYGDSSFCGNCFMIVARLLNYNIRTEYKHILQQIDTDLCLGVFDEAKSGFIRREVKPIKVVGKGKTSSGKAKKFVPIFKNFSANELEYWGHYGITQSVLDKYGVASLESCQFVKEDGKTYSIESSRLLPIFAYIFNEGEGYKFYRPKAENRFLYSGKLPKPYIFGWKQLPSKGEYVFITGGEKDVMSLAAHGFSAIALNSETAKVPEEIIEELSSRFGEIIFLYDSDATGKKESCKQVALYSDKYKVSSICLPLAGTKKEKDISDFFSLGKGRQDLLDIIRNNI